MAREITIGVDVWQFRCELDELREVWRLADDGGFDNLWVCDHFLPLVPNEDYQVPIYEAWSLVVAMAEATKRIRVGVMVLSWLASRPVTAEPFSRGFEEAQDVREDVSDVERLPHGELTGPRSYCLVRGVSEVVQRLRQPGLPWLGAAARPAHRTSAPPGWPSAGSAVRAGLPGRPAACFRLAPPR